MRSGTVEGGRALIAAVVSLAAVAALAFVPEGLVPDGINLGAMALGAGLLGLLSGLSGARRHRRRDRHDVKLSEELDALSRRLIQSESRLASLEQAKIPGQAGDVARDIGELSEVVKNLGNVISGQDRELAALKRAVERGTPPPVPQPGFAAAIAGEAAAVPSFLPAAGTPSPGAPKAEPKEASHRVDPVAIMSALADRQVDLHVQPIVTLPQRRPLVHDLYALLRLQDGQVLVPGQFLPTLDRLGLTADLDEIVIGAAFGAVRELAASDRDGVLACQLSRRSLSDPAVRGRVEDLVGRHDTLSSRVVIEIAHRDWPETGAAKAFVGRLRDRGIGFALAQVTDPMADPALLAADGVRYVKVAAASLHVPTDDAETEDMAELLSDRLARHGIRLVAERVEDEGLVPELIELGVPLAQGFAFALPAPIATLIAPRPAKRAESVKPDAVAPEPQADPPPPARRPLRSFLRRAG